MRWAASDVSPSSHLAFHIPTLAGFCLLFVLCSCLVLLLWCVFGFLFCECLGIPNSPRSLDLDDRQGLIARSAMQQKKKRVLSSSRPQPSRSFRPTRLLAALPCLTSFPSPVFAPFPPSRSSTAGTQSVIPAHSVLDCPPPSPPSSHLSLSLLP